MWNESPYNGVDDNKTVRELFDKCRSLKGRDGCTNAPTKIGLLRRVADILSVSFKQLESGFVRPKSFPDSSVTVEAEFVASDDGGYLVYNGNIWKPSRDHKCVGQITIRPGEVIHCGDHGYLFTRLDLGLSNRQKRTDCVLGIKWRVLNSPADTAEVLCECFETCKEMG